MPSARRAHAIGLIASSTGALTDAVERVARRLPRRHGLALGVEVEHEAMTQRGHRDVLNVLDREVVASVEQRGDAAREAERLGAARAGPSRT